MRYFWKIWAFALFAAVACLLTCFFVGQVFSDMLYREAAYARENGEIVFSALKREIGQSVLSYYTDMDLAAKAFERDLDRLIPAELSAMEFAILDSDGNELCSALPDGFTAKVQTQNDTGFWYLDKTGDGHFVCVLHPVSIGGKRYFIASVRNADAVYRARDRLIRHAFTALAAMLALSGAALYLYSRRSLRRIGALTQITKRLAAGDLTVRADSNGTDELAELASGLNRMTAQIAAQMDTLREEAQRKELFVGAFSHELKTPMTSIIGYADILLRKELTQEQTYMCLHYIYTEGKRLESMSMRLLDLIILGKQEIHLRPVSVPSLIRDVVTLIMPQITKADIRLIYNAMPGEIEMEEELMKTVFINLLDNACNAMESGGEIRIDGAWRQGAYIVGIRDNGKGMEPEVLSRITDAFYMEDKSRSRRHGGAGLGLAICSEILSLHGFSIRFESAPGKGTLAEVTMKGGEKG